jgi:hypothetical protein
VVVSLTFDGRTGDRTLADPRPVAIDAELVGARGGGDLGLAAG